MRKTDLIAWLGQGKTMEYLHFLDYRDGRARITECCLSQWYARSLEFEGRVYPTAEHFMMAEKARLFGDEVIRDAICGARSPHEAKLLGRAVRGYDERIWVRHREEIVARGSLEKFAQNQDIRDFLLGTGDRVLVEASPFDPIWGSGVDSRCAMANQPDRWPGENLLGFILMDTREQLRKTAP